MVAKGWKDGGVREVLNQLVNSGTDNVEVRLSGLVPDVMWRQVPSPYDVVYVLEEVDNGKPCKHLNIKPCKYPNINLKIFINMLKDKIQLYILSLTGCRYAIFSNILSMVRSGVSHFR